MVFQKKEETQTKEETKEMEKTENKYLIVFRSPPGADTVGKSRKKSYVFTNKPHEWKYYKDAKNQDIPYRPPENQIKLLDGDGIIVDERTYKHYTTTGAWKDEPKYYYDEPSQQWKWDADPFITCKKYDGDELIGKILANQFPTAIVDKEKLIQEIKHKINTSPTLNRKQLMSNLQPQ